MLFIDKVIGKGKLILLIEFISRLRVVRFFYYWSWQIKEFFEEIIFQLSLFFLI